MRIWCTSALTSLADWRIPRTHKATGFRTKKGAFVRRRLPIAAPARRHRSMSDVGDDELILRELEHVPAKWMPVRRQEHAPLKNSRACPDSKGTGYALERGRIDVDHVCAGSGLGRGLGPADRAFQIVGGRSGLRQRDRDALLILGSAARQV